MDQSDRIFLRVSLVAAAIGSLGASPPASTGDTVPPPPAVVQTITDPAQLFTIPTALRSIAHPLKLEGRISYVDRRWRHLWLERDGLGTYLPLSANPPPLEQGQRVAIEGTIVPAEGLDAGRVLVRVLAAFDPVQPIDTTGRIDHIATLSNRIVTAHAYVDAQQLIDDDHLELSLIIDNQAVIGWVKPVNPKSLPDWRGGFVRITGMYQGRFDPTHTQANIEIWTGHQEDVQPVGSTTGTRPFDAPLRPIDEIYQVPPGGVVRVRGQVMVATPASSLVIRDHTGQIFVESIQRQRLAPGTEVEAVGQVAVSNSQWKLRSALYRVARPAPAPETADSRKPLDRIDKIRRLSVEEAEHGRPVEFTGVVSWSLPPLNFFFVEDITGGIRVQYRPGLMATPPRNKYLRIRGVTYGAGFAPGVLLQSYDDLGAMSTPPTRTVSFEQAISGEEDGQLVVMRGFYRSTETDGEVKRVHVTTPAGEFIALLRSSMEFAPTPGSLIRVVGACEVTLDGSGRVTGVMLRVPSLASMTVEENAPADFYDLPLRPIKHLRQLSTARDFMRVRVSGVVLHAVPGRLIYLEDEQAGLLLLSHKTAPLAPGDRIEAVGILGWEGVRTVIREAVYRKIGVAAPPVPARLDDPSRLAAALDSRLVSVRGTLIDMIRRPEHLRLTLQAGDTLFEAMLENAPDRAPPPLPAIGSGLDLTGIYRLGFDDSRQSRRFQLELRSHADIVVLQKARVWTPQRALIVIAVLGGCAILGLGWVTLLRRRVRQQTAQIRSQLERQAQLEAEVQHATRLESLGVLAGGIAHDFNNLLTIVMGHLGLAMLDAKVMAAAGESLKECERGAIRARDLTQQLLTFAKGGDPLRSTVSLTEIVRETAEFVLRGSSSRCVYDLPVNLWSADVDRAQIAQMIQNLVLNAMQAMPNGGIIRVSIRNEEIAAGTDPALVAGRYLRLVFTDSGCGISRENLSRIFDPYFSTKTTGSGLGLATVYSIVKKHRGHIRVDSAPGAGSIFTLWLPAADPQKRPAATAAAPEAEAGGTSGREARALLMDDEEPIRRLGAAMLRRMHVATTLVANGEEALREFAAARDAGRPFDLVILDLTIPGAMGGRETIGRIRALDREVPAIVSSGYSNDPVLADFRSHGFQAIVSKPYDVKELCRTVDALLKAQVAAR